MNRFNKDIDNGSHDGKQPVTCKPVTCNSPEAILSCNSPEANPGKQQIWKDYQKEIADDHYFYARSCIRQTFFPGSEWDVKPDGHALETLFLHVSGSFHAFFH